MNSYHHILELDSYIFEIIRFERAQWVDVERNQASHRRSET